MKVESEYQILARPIYYKDGSGRLVAEYQLGRCTSKAHVTSADFTLVVEAPPVTGLRRPQSFHSNVVGIGRVNVVSGTRAFVCHYMEKVQLSFPMQ